MNSRYQRETKVSCSSSLASIYSNKAKESGRKIVDECGSVIVIGISAIKEGKQVRGAVSYKSGDKEAIMNTLADLLEEMIKESNDVDT